MQLSCGGQDQLNQLQLIGKEIELVVPQAYVSQPEANLVIQQQQEIVVASYIQQEFELISENVKTSNCWAMAMDKSEKVLVIGSGNSIKYLKYDNGSYTITQMLIGHTGCVKCLCFSKKNNWFISGSNDRTIRIWNEQENGEWIKLQKLEGHLNDVCNVILNDDEDQFISCSRDKTIKVWMKQTDCLLWECKQTLTEHTNIVYQLSFNPDCDMLASCGQDRLRIWKKGIDKLWSQRQVVDKPNNDPYMRVSFINADELIATTDKQGRFHRLTVNDNGQFRVSQELVLNDIGEPLPICFPIIYHKELKMAICRHSDEYTYILIQQVEGEFKIHQVLNNKYHARYLSKDGRQLILQNYKTEKIEIWKVKIE